MDSQVEIEMPNENTIDGGNTTRMPVRHLDSRPRARCERERADQLYRLYGPMVYRRCLALLKDPRAAANETQRFFQRSLRTPERFERPAGVTAWLFEAASLHCASVLAHASGDLPAAPERDVG